MQKTDLVTGLLHRTYLSVSPQTGILTARAHGIDLSKYDLGFDRSKTTNQLDFVALRSSYRLTKDQLFDVLLQAIQSVPIRIAYHYYNFGYSGDGTWMDQVNFMVPLVKGNGFHATAWDFEEAFNIMSQVGAVNSYYAIQELEQRLGMPCFLYTSLNLYNNYIYPTVASHGLNWNGVKLWLAQWLFTPDPNKNPSIPKGRTGRYWDLWQYTDQGSEYGTVRNYPTDLDVFNGTVEEMKAFLNIDGGTNPPGGNMEETHKGTVLQTLNVRSGPGTQYPQKLPTLGYLKKDDVVYGVWDTVTQWFHFDRIERVTGQTEDFDAWASAVNGTSANPPYMRVEDYVPTPPAGVADMPYKITFGGKYPDGTDSPYEETTVTGVVKAK